MPSKVAPDAESNGVLLGGSTSQVESTAMKAGASTRSGGKSLQAHANKSSIWWTLDSLSMSTVQISEPVSRRSRRLHSHTHTQTHTPCKPNTTERIWSSGMKKHAQDAASSVGTGSAIAARGLSLAREERAGG